MHHKLAVLFVAIALSVPALAAKSPAEAWRTLQDAAAARDVEAMAAVLAPEERETLRAEVARAGVEIVMRRIPKGALTITSESEHTVAATVEGRALLFVKDDAGQWSVAAMFAKPKKPVATLEAVPSVRVEGRAVVGMKPIRDAGQPNEFAIPGMRAYELLRDEARNMRPNARLYSLSTSMHALSPDGASSGWIGEFLTETPGELLTLIYEDGEIEPRLRSVDLDRAIPLPDEMTVVYDTKKLYEEAVRLSAGIVDPITRVTASLYRSLGSGKAIWLLNVYDDGDHIGQTVVFHAKGMTFSHKTK